MLAFLAFLILLFQTRTLQFWRVLFTRVPFAMEPPQLSLDVTGLLSKPTPPTVTTA